MSSLTNYILKGAMYSLMGIAIGEAAIVTIEAVKLRKEVIKHVKSQETVDILDVKEAKSAATFFECIKRAAKQRVKEIKENPASEIMALWGCATYLMGNWKGYFAGFGEGYDFGSKDVEELLTTFKVKAPNEFKALITKLKKDKLTTLLSEWTHNDITYRNLWSAEHCDISDLKESANEIIKEATGV